MDILSFNKITKPIYEGGTTIDCRPRGKWFVEVRRTDGTIRYPFGDKWIDNVFLNAWADNHMGGTGSVAGNYSFGNPIAVDRYSWLNFFFGFNAPTNEYVTFAVGSGTTPAQQTNTTLANQIRFDSTKFVTGNSITWNSTTGDIVFTNKQEFPAETGLVTYNEAGLRLLSGNSLWTINGLATDTARLINRVVFPGSINLSSGEKLILTLAVTMSTLASSAGKTITIAAQNGVNISGVLKCIGTQASMAGGTVTSAGVITQDKSYATLFNICQTPVALLSTKTAFDTLGVNPTWGTTNQVNGIWGSYTNGTRFRDIGYQWNNGTPATDTNFQSILFRNVTSGSAYGGYQLLLNNQMTKATAATLAINLRFTI